MKIAVYCGSSFGQDPGIQEEARQLGSWIGTQGHTLVYGGGKVGLMGLVSGAVLQAGGTVIGVIPEFLHTPALTRTDCSQLIVTADMAERKRRMEELADACIALPGGTGTLEEISEVMAQLKLGQYDKPVLLLNWHGFYEPLKQQLQRMTVAGFLPADCLERIRFVPDVREAVTCFSQHL